IPKISEAFRRKLMPSRIGAEPSVSGPTVKLSTSRISERSISKASVYPVARLLQSRADQIDRSQRDGKKHPWAGGDPPRINEVLARVGDDAAETRRRRLDAKPQKAEDRFENHHARDVEHGDKGDRRQNVRRREQQQDAPVAGPENTKAANIFQTALGHRSASSDACIKRPAGQCQDDDDGGNGRTRYAEDRDREDDHRDRQLRVGDPHNDRIPPLSLETRE